MSFFVESLEKWFQQFARELPWRAKGDPYQILLSEVMSQQTTMKAILPYFDRFIQHFPSVSALAEASLDDVLALWAGLGYPSRARNLHLTARQITKKGFPKTYKGLLDLPGVGPYTAAALASMAFGEKVGVVDGNVIRVLSRFLDEPIEHWRPRGRQYLQTTMDNWIQNSSKPGAFNQAVMELGALVCTKHNPKCGACPVSTKCRGLKNDNLEALPLQKPRRKMEHWQWSVTLKKSKNQKYWVTPMPKEAPILKNQLVFDGALEQLESAPKDFFLKHTITHHHIYVQLKICQPVDQENISGGQWISREELLKKSPFSLLSKIMDAESLGS